MGKKNLARRSTPCSTARIELLEVRRLHSAALLDKPVIFDFTADRVPEAFALGDNIVFAADASEVNGNALPVAYDISTGQVTEPAQPHAGFGYSDAALGNQFFVAGGTYGGEALQPGTDQVDIYNSQTDQWSTAHLSQARLDMAAVVVNGHVIFAGGAQDSSPGGNVNFSTAVDIYDSTLGRWSTTSLPVDGGYLGLESAQIGDKAVFVTEYGSGLAEVFDTTTSQWTTHPMSQDRLFPVPVNVRNKLLFAGGIYYDHLGNPHNSSAVDIYDDQTGQWSVASLTVASDNIASTVMGNVALLALGNSQIAIYSADTGQWSTHSLPSSNAGTNVVADGNLALFFGSHGVDVYHSDTGQWVHVGSATPAGIESATTKGLVGNEVAFFSSDGKQINLYDPATNTWSIDISGTGVTVSTVIASGDKLFALGATLGQYGTPGAGGLDILSPTNLAAPMPVSPVNSSAYATSYVFRWTPTIGATGYDLYLDHRRIAANVGAIRFALPNGLAGGQHAWQVVAITPDGRISSQPATFTSQVPRIVATYKSDDLPATLPERTQGTVKVKISNTGDAPLTAPFRVSILASSNGSIRNRFYLLSGGSFTGNTPLQPGDSLDLSIPVAFNFKEDPFGDPVNLLVVVDRPAGGRHGSHRQFFAVRKGPSLPV